MQKKSWPKSWMFFLVFVIYQCLWHLIIPFILARLWWKGRKEPGYRKHISERFGFYGKESFSGAVWIHAVSVGETRAAAPLIEALIAKGHRILLTHMTPTGRHTGQDIFAKHLKSGQLIQSYVPYDFCWPVSRFYRKYQPNLGLFMETELWPSLLFFSVHRFPIQLINGRLSLKSSLSFARFGSLSKVVFGMFDSILAQSQADQMRYVSLDVKNVFVTGNLKFDVQLSPEQISKGQVWKAQISGKRILCLASTREGEEELIIRAWQQLADPIRPILLIVPRHLPRVPEIESFLKKEGITYTKRTNLPELAAITEEVFIGDSMGEMALYLSLADLVVMGGSWLGTGGQNLIEPISLGKPVIVGPSMYNFAHITQEATNQGFVLQLQGATTFELEEQLRTQLTRLLKDGNIMQMTELSKAYAKQHQGATKKTMQYLKLAS
jgi:3-deoxy-D-manno-octulosonic-acid transferase